MAVGGIVVAAAVVSVLLAASAAAPGQPIHERIDQLIADKSGGQPAAPAASDAEFLRRVYLDLNGTIATVAEARQFLADTSSDKRARLIDQLLSRPEYARRMQEAFGVMLMERRGRDGEAVAKWEQFLRDAFAQNKPWDQITREILNPDPTNEATRGAALFYTKRLEAEGQVPIDYPGVARDVGRMFLGVDLRCAQCHNHKSIEDYTQADFQGLFAYVTPTFIRTDTPIPTVGERLTLKKAEYVSVFSPGVRRETAPHLPGMPEVQIPMLAEAEQWAQAPDSSKNFPGVPKFSPLKALAEQLPRAETPMFTRNIANRLWFLMMGRGIVHPMDLHHSENPPSHPELLAYLAEQFAAGKFDGKAMLRELALSQTYQRSSQLPEGYVETGAPAFSVAITKRPSAEQLMWSVLTATGELEVANDAAKAAELRKKFVTAFASPAGEPEVEFAPTVAAALFLSNDRAVLDRLQPRPGNLVDRLSKLPDANAVAEELYLSVLTRMPTDEERADVVAYLAARAGEQRIAALSDLGWSLLSSTEFCVNH